LKFKREYDPEKKPELFTIKRKTINKVRQHDTLGGKGTLYRWENRTITADSLHFPRKKRRNGAKITQPGGGIKYI